MFYVQFGFTCLCLLWSLIPPLFYDRFLEASRHKDLTPSVCEGVDTLLMYLYRALNRVDDMERLASSDNSCIVVCLYNFALSCLIYDLLIVLLLAWLCGEQNVVHVLICWCTCYQVLLLMLACGSTFTHFGYSTDTCYQCYQGALTLWSNAQNMLSTLFRLMCCAMVSSSKL